MRGTATFLAIVAAVLLLPAAAAAQGTLTGTVRDASGAVLPGVTVEAASDALIERVRTVTSDSSGQYRIVDLRPGTYSLTFSLNGFTAIRRDGIELAGSATLTIPAELVIGNLQETVVVTSETPVVDVQSVRRETVLSADVVAALPATRNYGAILAAIPGIELDGVSAQTTPEMTFFSARGGAANEGRVMIDGMNVAAAFNGGGVSSLTYNTNDTAEIQVPLSGGLGENETGGDGEFLAMADGMGEGAEWGRPEVACAV